MYIGATQKKILSIYDFLLIIVSIDKLSWFPNNIMLIANSFFKKYYIYYYLHKICNVTRMPRFTTKIIKQQKTAEKNHRPEFSEQKLSKLYLNNLHFR